MGDADSAESIRGRERTSSVNVHLRKDDVRECLPASELLRLAENAMPTCEKSLSTVAELAGHPRY